MRVRLVQLGVLLRVVASLTPALVATGCGSAKLVNVDKQFARLHPIQQATHSTVGRAELEPLLGVFPDRDAVTIVSQEVPFPVEQVWQVGVDQAEQLPPGVVHFNRGSWTVQIDRHRALRFLSLKLYVQSVLKLVPTPYDSTVIHYAVVRWETASVEESADGSSFQLRRVSRSETFELAVVELGHYVQEIRYRYTPGVPLAELPERLQELREEYEFARTAPADLKVEAEFDDRDGVLPNGKLDPGEEALVRVKVTNAGGGLASEVRLEASTSFEGVDLPAGTEMGDIEPGASEELEIPLRPGLDALPGRAVIALQAREARGYDSRSLELMVPVAELKRPSLRIVDVEIEDGPRVGGDGDGRIGSGEGVRLAAALENGGSGPAVGVELTVRSLDERIKFEAGALGTVTLRPLDVKTVRVALKAPPSLSAESLDLELKAVDGRGASAGSAVWTGSFPVVLRSPLVQVKHRVFDGNSPRSIGNRDGVANNGERLELEIQALNNGRLAAEDLELKVLAQSGGLEVVPSSVEVGTLPPRSDGPTERLLIDLPRGFRGSDPLRLDVVVRQRHFPESRRRLDLPFERLEPHLRLGPTAAVSVIPGRTEMITLTVANLGSLDARDVRVVVRTDAEDVRVLDRGGRPERERGFPVPRLVAGSDVHEIDLPLFIQRGDGPREEHLEVELKQADFAPATRRIRLDVVEESPERVVVRAADDRRASRSSAGGGDRTPPDLWLTEPVVVDGGRGTPLSLVVTEPRVRVRGKVRDAGGVYELSVDGRAVALDEDGGFSTWVRLGYGANLVRIRASDPDGNLARAALRIERRHETVPSAERRDRAVLFVTGRYERWSSLSNPVPDGRALASVLESVYGFGVELVVDPTLTEILRTLRRYASQTPGPRDQLLVFFAGHGRYDERFGEGFIVAHDSLQSDEVGQTYLSHSRLSTILNHLPHRHLLVVLDVCFGGAFDQRLSETARRGGDDYEEASRKEFIRRRLVATSRLYIASGGKEYVPEGLPGRHSPFLSGLLEVLNNRGGRDRILTADELFADLLEKRLTPEPRAGGFGSNEPGGGFLFVAEE